MAGKAGRDVHSATPAAHSKGAVEGELLLLPCGAFEHHAFFSLLALTCSMLHAADPGDLSSAPAHLVAGCPTAAKLPLPPLAQFPPRPSPKVLSALPPTSQPCWPRAKRNSTPATSQSHCMHLTITTSSGVVCQLESCGTEHSAQGGPEDTSVLVCKERISEALTHAENG